MTEGRIPSKGEPEPPDATNPSGSAKKKSNNDDTEEMDVQAYQQPDSMDAPKQEARSAMGEPEPPDNDGSGA